MSAYYSHGWIMRQWAPGHRHIKDPHLFYTGAEHSHLLVLNLHLVVFVFILHLLCSNFVYLCSFCISLVAIKQWDWLSHCFMVVCLLFVFTLHLYCSSCASLHVHFAFSLWAFCRPSWFCIFSWSFSRRCDLLCVFVSLWSLRISVVVILCLVVILDLILVASLWSFFVCWCHSILPLDVRYGFFASPLLSFCFSTCSFCIFCRLFCICVFSLYLYIFMSLL